MSPPEIDAEVHRQLGALDAKIDRILADQLQARVDRKQQYDKQENMQRQLDEVGRDVKSLDSRVGKIEPITADIGRWRERFIGMRMLIVVVSAAMGGLVVAAGKWIALKLGWSS